MRYLLSSGLVLIVSGCGLAPEPLDLRPFEKADHRFAPPPPEAPAKVSEAVLEKEELTLQDVLEIADLLNPDLAAERKNMDLATTAIWEASLHPNPSFIAEIEDFRTKDGATAGKMERSAGLSFPLAIGGRIGAATSAAEKEREIAAVNYIWRRREILSGVKRAFIACLVSRGNADLAREARDLAKTLHEVTNDRFKARAIPEMELLKAAVQLAKAQSDLRIAEKDAAVSIKSLHARMGNADFPEDRIAGELPRKFIVPSLEALRGQAVALHPLAEAALKAKEAAELHLASARAERFPDVGLQVTVGKDPEDATIVEAGISIPLPVFNRNQARIAAAEIRIRMAELRIQSVRNDLLHQLDEAYRTFTAAQDRAAVYADEILPKARKALDQTNEGYEQGKFRYLDVLDAQRTLAEARIACSAAVADLNGSSVELEKLTGTNLVPIR